MLTRSYEAVAIGLQSGELSVEKAERAMQALDGADAALTDAHALHDVGLPVEATFSLAMGFLSTAGAILLPEETNVTR